MSAGGALNFITFNQDHSCLAVGEPTSPRVIVEYFPQGANWRDSSSRYIQGLSDLPH